MLLRCLGVTMVMCIEARDTVVAADVMMANNSMNKTLAAFMRELDGPSLHDTYRSQKPLRVRGRIHTST